MLGYLMDIAASILMTCFFIYVVGFDVGFMELQALLLASAVCWQINVK